MRLRLLAVLAAGVGLAASAEATHVQGVQGDGAVAYWRRRARPPPTSLVPSCSRPAPVQWTGKNNLSLGHVECDRACLGISPRAVGQGIAPNGNFGALNSHD